MRKAILIVTGGILQTFAVKEAKILGLVTIVTDIDPHCACAELADHFEQIDIHDIEGHLRLIDRLKKNYNLRGVFTTGSSCEATVAAGSEYARLPGIPFEVAQSCQNKQVMRRKLASTHPVKSWCVQETGEGFSVLEGNSYYQKYRSNAHPDKIIVKPVDNCGARGISIVSNKKFYTRALHRAALWSRTNTIIVEPLLSGSEHTVEIVFDRDEQPYDLNICDRYFARPGTEVGHCNPSHLPKETKARLYEFARSIAKTIGVSFGVFKCDVILDGTKPYLIECTARLSGGFDSQWTQPKAYGTNPTRAAILLSIGEKLNWDDITPKLTVHEWDSTIQPHTYHAVCKCYFSERTGIIKEMVTKHWSPEVDWLAVFMRKRPGDTIRSLDDCENRVLYAMASEESHGQAERDVDAILGSVEVEFE